MIVEWSELNSILKKKRSSKKLCKKWEHLTGKKSLPSRAGPDGPMLIGQGSGIPSVKQRALEPWAQCVDDSVTVKEWFSDRSPWAAGCRAHEAGSVGCVDASFEFSPLH